MVKTFKQFVAEYEAGDLGWADQFISGLIQAPYHKGDCTKENHSCSLCVLQNLLEEYYEYCKTENHCKMRELKSLAQHNSESWAFHQQMNENSPVPNGIACPVCGLELFDSNPMITLTSNPPQKNVHCNCGYVGYRIA